MTEGDLFVSANIMQAGHPGATFEWALAQVMDNSIIFEKAMEREAVERSARTPSPEEPAR